MYLSLLCLNPASAAVQRDLRDVTELHRTIMRAFPAVGDPDVEARAYFGVLHRLEFERSTGRVLLYVQSRKAPEWSRLPEGYFFANQAPQVRPLGDAYAGLGAGRMLRFRLRANPTRKVDTKTGPDGVRRNGRRVPVRGPEQQIAWLARKAEEHGFELLEATVAASGSGELQQSYRTGRTFQGVVFEGRLAVRDPERFLDGLTKGMGSGKAFGFGLLSVGPD